MFGFLKSQKAEVIEHWIAFVDGFQLVPTEFYTLVENELKTRQVPGLEMSRVDFAEGGVLSDKRVYLRMVRERLVFDVCAAPFGVSFFFSCRFAEIPVVVQLWQLLVLVGALGISAWLLLGLLTKVLGVSGFFFTPFAWIALLALAIYVMRNSMAMGLKDLDATLIKSPLVGSLYERWIRKETYYRHATRLMYLQIVSGVIKQLAEEAVATKGFKLTKQYKQASILGDLYKPLPPETRLDAPAP